MIKKGEKEAAKMRRKQRNRNTERQYAKSGKKNPRIRREGRKEKKLKEAR